MKIGFLCWILEPSYSDRSAIINFESLIDEKTETVVFCPSNCNVSSASVMMKKLKKVVLNGLKYFFFGINLFMSIKTLPSYREYWSTSTDFHDSFISQLMTVNRFGWLLTHLHMNDNTLQPKKGDYT